RIAEAEYHPPDAESREHLADHRRLVERLPPLPGGPRDDEDGQQAENQVHGAPLPGNPVHEASRYLFITRQPSGLVTTGNRKRKGARLAAPVIRRLLTGVQDFPSHGVPFRVYGVAGSG